ncbi:hypothetical protein CDD83_1979 [Cordyceps sp. RAO-2017]|nr:hypothetical protein CDD83_1979 [Cordyceps sp. RAO-2017]
MPNKTMDYGDLRITLTSDYGWNWDDSGSGANRSVMVWTPSIQGDMRPLGSVAFGSGFHEAGGTRASLLVGRNPNSGGNSAVARPVRFEWLWNDKGSGGKHSGTFWRPVAPDGFVALGDVCTYKWGEPSLNSIWCLRADLVKDGAFPDTDIWNDRGSGGAWDCSLWQVTPKPVGVSGSESIPVFADTFRFNGAYSRPNSGLASVPALSLPKSYTPFTAPVPAVTPTTIPDRGNIYNETNQCAVTLPFTAFFRPDDRRSLDNIANPFCTVSKSVAWKVEGVWVNDAAGDFTRSQTVKYGISKEQKEEMQHSVGVEVSVEGGIKAVSYSVSLNYQFTYSSSTSFTEYTEKTVEEKFTVPEYSAKVLFSKHVWLRGKRSDGSDLSYVEVAANDDTHFGGCKLPR